MNFYSVLSLVTSLLARLADLLIEWRISRGATVSGVGSIMDRVGAIVLKWSEMRFDGLSPDEANAARRHGALGDLKIAGIDVSEKYARWLIESALIKRDAEAER